MEGWDPQWATEGHWSVWGMSLTGVVQVSGAPLSSQDLSLLLVKWLEETDLEVIFSLELGQSSHPLTLDPSLFSPNLTHSVCHTVVFCTDPFRSPSLAMCSSTLFFVGPSSGKYIWVMELPCPWETSPKIAHIQRLTGLKFQSSAPWLQAGQTLRYNLCSRAPPCINLWLGFHLKLHSCLAFPFSVLLLPHPYLFVYVFLYLFSSFPQSVIGSGDAAGRTRAKTLKYCG